MTTIFKLFAIFSILSSCYSFKGISIPADINTYTVEIPDEGSSGAPGIYQIEFNEALNLKIRRESRLILNNDNPDITFKCRVSQYEISPQAPNREGGSALNRLTITMDVIFTNKKDEKANWNHKFSRFEDFPPNANFNTEQIRLHEVINTLLTEDIFNKAFANW